MTGLGTFINVGAILAGGLLGLLLRRGIPERFKETIFHTLGVSTMLIGGTGVAAAMLRVAEGGLLERTDMLLMILSLVVGAVAGELLNIERGFERLGALAQRKLAPKEGGASFSAGFVNASVLFCVGAMAVVGSLEDGLAHDPTTLAAKAILDGVICVVFASAYGPGVLLSALPVLVYQGGITLLSGLLAPIATPEAMGQMSLVGSALVMCIGFNMLGLTKMRLANWIPATFVPLVYDAVRRLF
ncbi:MAG: DUF554 domain-containing protein [Oscillospiraceae bacterium]|jgi:uncharacterized membrane protein YqgA involved in biofilm formation|nr:DUF554 domain-containing protein [Oscillospiraceae bacterium]